LNLDHVIEKQRFSSLSHAADKMELQFQKWLILWNLKHLDKINKIRNKRESV